MGTKKTPYDKYWELMNRTNETAVAILRDGKLVATVIGRHPRDVLYMGMKWYLPQRDTEPLYATEQAGGYGYSKRSACIQSMMSDLEDKIQEAYGVKFRNPEHYDPKGDRRLNWQYIHSILKDAGFQIIDVLGSLD